MTRIKTDRNIFIFALLNIITCGIYSYWFIYQLAQDVNVMCKEDGKTTGGLLMFIILSTVTCGIYAILGNSCVNAPVILYIFSILLC